MTPPPPAPRPPFLSTPVLICATIMLLGLLGSVVFLSWSGRSVEYIAGVLSALTAVGVTVLGALGKVVQLHAETQHQNRTLEVIAHNTDDTDRR